MKVDMNSSDGDAPRVLARTLFRSASQGIGLDDNHMVRDSDLEAFLSESERHNVDPSMGACLPKRGEWDKPDGRLHHEYPLYCEGMSKPTCRGIFHLVCCLILPFGMWKLIRESNGNTTGTVTAVLYVASNMFCYGASATYHVGQWSAKTEILLQKLDHAGIAVMSVGTFLPTIFLLFPIDEGVLFLTLLVGACIRNVHGIFNLQPSLLGQVFVPATSCLFIYRLWEVFTATEFSLYILTIIIKMIGVSVFVRKKPDPIPAIFGYHEVFHCFVIAAGACIYTCNYSIIHRICNPFAHDTELGDSIRASIKTFADILSNPY